jgi:hypothetical protein
MPAYGGKRLMYDSGNYQGCLDKALAAFAYKTRRAEQDRLRSNLRAESRAVHKNQKPMSAREAQAVMSPTPPIRIKLTAHTRSRLNQDWERNSRPSQA